MNRVLTVLLMLDELGASIFFGLRDRTISSICGQKIEREEDCPLCRALCKVLNWIVRDHCPNAARGE